LGLDPEIKRKYPNGGNTRGIIRFGLEKSRLKEASSFFPKDKIETYISLAENYKKNLDDSLNNLERLMKPQEGIVLATELYNEIKNFCHALANSEVRKPLRDALSDFEKKYPYAPVQRNLLKSKNFSMKIENL